jgi:hypothetical protein
VAPIIVTAIVAVAAGVCGYIKLTSDSATTPVSPSTSAAPVVRGFDARVAWTNDGGGGGSDSTNLFSFAGPNSNIHEDIYTLGESLTVVCKTTEGQQVSVGPAYKGPDPRSTIWYELDNYSWVPAVYVYTKDASTIPDCT